MSSRSPVPAREVQDLPCPESLLAATLTFMTAHAQACCDHHRQLITEQVVENLFTLSEHPLLSPQFRSALWDLNTHWRRMNVVAAPRPTSQIHAAPSVVQ